MRLDEADHLTRSVVGDLRRLRGVSTRGLLDPESSETFWDMTSVVLSTREVWSEWAKATLRPWLWLRRRAPHIGMGVGAGSRPGEWRIVARAWSLDDWHTPALERVRSLPAGEVDLRITGVIQPRALPLGGPGTKTCRPLVAGCSIGHHQMMMAGTLGAFVRQAQGGLLMLSNNHVLVEGNRRSANDAIVQPGLQDGGQLPGGAVGQLQEFVRLLPDANVVDAAVATVDDSALPDDLALPGIGLIKGCCTAADLAVRLETRARVHKIGRTTGMTSGILTSVIRDFPVSYNGTERWFGSVIEVTSTDNGRPFSDQGDSGALVVDDDGLAVGIIFSGDEEATYLNPMAAVLGSLQVSF
jgi:hypothetical protein